MWRARLLVPALFALTATACSSQQASYFSTSPPQTAEIEERGLFTGGGPFASRRSSPAYAQPASVQAPPVPQQPYTAQAYPQSPGQQAYTQHAYAQQAYAAQPPTVPQQQANVARGQVVEQRYGPNSYVLQYQPPPQATGGPYAPAPYGYAYAYPPPPPKPSPVY
jgi:hypothetical protein